MKAILNFVKAHFKLILEIGLGLFLLYWILFFLTPKVEMGAESKRQIDSLNTYIKDVEKEQKVLDEKIGGYNHEVNLVESRIEKIKTQKETIKEIYHEKISSVNTYTDSQLDSFFTNRYGFNPR
jgi:vacuolar-type H+-ATPase subunit I/STV1